jgi:predicted alpha/beta superfamily hydrolase
MGGLISLYGFLARPNVFGFAGGLSPALWFADEALTRFVADLAQPPQGKLYLDAGWKELRGVHNARSKSREYVEVVRRLRDALLHKGYQEGRDLLYIEDHAGTHQEQDWSRRLPDALRFLLSRQDYTP